MRTSRRTRMMSMLGAIVLILQMSPAGAAGQAVTHGDREQGTVVIAFQKWMLNGGAGPLMEGYIWGPSIGWGQFTGEVLVDDARPDFKVGRLEAIYHFQGGSKSFTAVIRGAYSLTGLGILQGHVLDGWRAGAPVQVRFQAVSCSQAPDGTCFQGSIKVERVP